MKFFGSILENKIPTLGKSCGAGSTTIGLAGAGIGVSMYQPQVFKRTMHRMSYGIYNAASRNFSSFAISKSYSSMFAAKDTDFKNNVSQNCRYIPHHTPSYTNHFAVFRVPLCECEDDIIKFRGYDKIKCLLETQHCALKLSSIELVGYVTHNGKKDIIDGKPIYMENYKDNDANGKLVYKRLHKFLCNRLDKIDIEGKTTGDQFIHVFKKSIALYIPLEQIVCFNIIDSKFLAVNSPKLLKAIDAIQGKNINPDGY